jgi:UDP-2,3-diacylglucosamine hydrolase
MRVVDFISDLHLSPELPRTLAALDRYLEATRADALFILGDLFRRGWATTPSPRPSTRCGACWRPLPPSHAVRCAAIAISSSVRLLRDHRCGRPA